MNYPRRQQYRRVRRAATAGAAGVLAAGLALLAASLGAVPVAAVLLLVAVALGGYARHWARLAGRSRVGARSEDQVQRALAPLHAEGWRLRHSLPWQGRGDIDSVAISPTGIAFAIETKDQEVRGPARRAGNRDGRMAAQTPAALVSSRRAPRPMRSPRQPTPTCRSRSADRFTGPTGRSAAHRGGHTGAPCLPLPRSQ